MQGDITFFDQFLVDVWEGLHDLETADIRLALTDGTTPPLATTPDPRWGLGGGTDFSSEEVAAGGNYVAGGNVCANPAVSLVADLAEFDADDPAAWAADAANPANPAESILYNNTDPGKRAIGFIDIGGLFDMTGGDLAITFGANGIGRLNQA